MLKIFTVLAATLFFLQVHSVLLNGGDSYLPILQSLLLVLLGPMLSILLTYPHPEIRALWQELASPRPAEEGEEDLAEQIRQLARKWNISGSRDLDQETAQIPNPFLRKGVEMIVDGYSGEEIRRVLEKNYDRHLSGRQARLQILASLVRLTQSFGFMGTVVGLISVLSNLSDQASIGSGVSVALFTTLYGLLFANFIYIPAHRRYAERIRQELHGFPLISEGVLGLARRENAAHLYYKLRSCFEGEAAPVGEAAARPLRLLLAGCLFPRQGR
jgi:chemotaxis protein MotA